MPNWETPSEDYCSKCSMGYTCPDCAEWQSGRGDTEPEELPLPTIRSGVEDDLLDYFDSVLEKHHPGGY